MTREIHRRLRNASYSSGKPDITAIDNDSFMPSCTRILPAARYQKPPTHGNPRDLDAPTLRGSPKNGQTTADL